METADELQKRIDELPQGTVAIKTVNGRRYSYHRWQENGKRRERCLSAEEALSMVQAIEERKRLESELRVIKAYELLAPSVLANVTTTYGCGDAPANNAGAPAPERYHMRVLTGMRLYAMAKPVARYRHRDCLKRLQAFLASPQTDRVFILYGLRRTGKTTLIRQAILAMDDVARAKTAFVQTAPKNTLADINHDLALMEERGIETVFIDEATLMDDFIEGAALLSDIFAASGLKIVLSGTDSLGFLFAQDEQLYDRCELLHTTHVSYGEFSRVLGLTGIDTYLRYGGTMSMSGASYNTSSPFASAANANQYVDTAIAHNIQHSLACYQYGGHFRSLQELYRADELTSAINRVVEDINHRFAVDVLTRAFKSNDLAISASNLRRDRQRPTNILERIDVDRVTTRLRTKLSIRNADERHVQIDEGHAREISEYLELLDLIDTIEVRSATNSAARGARTVITQPGLRYAQATALLEALVDDDTFGELPLAERKAIAQRIESEILGRMMEDVVLLETKLARPNCKVFVLQFGTGEFDMVVFDAKHACCEIYEIKHSDQRAPQQTRHLTDTKKREQTEFRYGPITKTTVLYRGENTHENGADYVNVEEYLCRLAN